MRMHYILNSHFLIFPEKRHQEIRMKILVTFFGKFERRTKSYKTLQSQCKMVKSISTDRLESLKAQAAQICNLTPCETQLVLLYF